MNKLALAATLGALTFALPARAADFSPPEGCASFLTVQSKGCIASLLWRCDVAPEGDFWEATFSGEGLESIVSYDGDYQWRDAIYLWDNSREEFVPPADDPISINELLANGADTYDFRMQRSEPGASRVVRMVGADQLSGRTQVIDGIELEVVSTELQILDESGEVEYHSRGIQFLSRELRQFFLGPEKVFGADGAVSEYDGSPIDFIFPGEPGFGGTVPLYECDKQKAGFAPVAPQAGQEETIHDQI